MVKNFFYDSNSRTLVWAWFLANLSLFELCHSVEKVFSLCKRQKFQTSLSFHKRYFVVYTTLFDKNVSYSSRWRAPQYSVFFSRHRFVGKQSVENFLPYDKTFFAQFFFLIELLFFELIFSSEKRPPVEYLVRAE